MTFEGPQAVLHSQGAAPPGILQVSPTKQPSWQDLPCMWAGLPAGWRVEAVLLCSLLESGLAVSWQARRGWYLGVPVTA